MGNLVLSVLIMGGFSGFLLILCHMGIQNFIKGYKLDKQHKAFNATRSRYKAKPVFVRRDEQHISSVSLPNTEHQNMVQLPDRSRCDDTIRK